MFQMKPKAAQKARGTSKHDQQICCEICLGLSAPGKESYFVWRARVWQHISFDYLQSLKNNGHFLFQTRSLS